MLVYPWLLFVSVGQGVKDVPLRLTASQSPSTFPLAKSTQQEVWNQALVDLDAAASIFADSADRKRKTE